MNVFNNPYTQTPQVWSVQQASIYFVSQQDDGDLQQAVLQAGITQGFADDNSAQILGAIQGVTITHQRTSTTRYPIGGQRPIKMLGIPRGSVTLNSLVGPTTNLQNFLKLFSDSCKSFRLVIFMDSNKSANSRAKDAKGQKFTCKGCTGTALTYQIQSAQQGMSIAQGQFQIQFTDLDID